MSVLTSRLKFLDEAFLHRLGMLHGFAVANKSLLIYLAATAVVAFGYDLFTFSLRMDSEFHAWDAGAKLEWIAQGRWAMYYLSAWLLPDPVMPFLPVLTGLIGLTCGVLFFLLSLSGQRTPSDYLAAPIVIGCPLLAFGFYFTTLNYGLGIALALSGAGLYALTRWRRSSAAWAIACFAIAIGIYQSTILLMLASFGIYLVVQVIAVPHVRARWLLHRLAVFCAVMLAAYGLYELIRTAALHAYNIPSAKDYLEGYLNWTSDPSYWWRTIGRALKSAKSYYTGHENFYLYDLRIVAVLFWIVLVVTIVQLVAAPQSVAVRIIGLLALTVSLFAPVLLHLLNAGYMPPRTVLGVPFVFAGLVFAASFNNHKTLKIVLGFLVLGCFLKFAVVNTRYAFASELNWKADQDLSLLVLQRVHSVLQKLPDRSPPYPVTLVGVLRHRESPLYIRRDLIGSSFFYTNGGSTSRMVGLWRSMRQFDFRQASQEEMLSVAERAVFMPEWPAEGSVDVVNGVIVVKIGEYTPYQLMTLCESAPLSDFCERYTQRSTTDKGAGPILSLANYQGLWWNSPAASETGWGIELAHQGDMIFASWFTYDLSGRSWWLVMSAQKRAPNVYAGTLMEMHGPPFNATGFTPADVTSTPVGSATLKFRDKDNGTFDYTVNGISQTKTITRAMLGRAPKCVWAELPNLVLATNYQDLWWAAPPGSEPWWGINLNHHGDTVSATWFTYGADGAPLWMAVTAPKTAPGVYTGDVHLTAGARFDAFDPAAVQRTKVGTATFTFADGNNATFAYTVAGVGPGTVTQTKAITRLVFAPPGTACR